MSELKHESSSHDGAGRVGRARTIGAAAVVALIGLAAVVVIWVTRDGGTAPAAVPSSSSPSSSSSAPAPTSSAPQSSPAQPAEQAPLQSAPAGISWALFQGVALPTSSTAGPTRVSGAVHAGYEHSPTGALLAAAQISTRFLITPGQGWRRVVEEQVAPTAGREVYEQKRAKVTSFTVAPGTYGQFAGFRFVTYTPDVAVIQYATRFANGNLQVTTATVQWLDGDWKLQLQPDGSSSPTAQSVTSLSGFIPWSGL